MAEIKEILFLGSPPPKKQTLEEMIYNIKIDLASIKNDITWLKRLFTGCVVIVGAMFSVDMSGIVV